MAEKLSQRRVDAATAPDGADVFLWDSELRGFGLRLRGGRRLYVVQYRNRAGKTRRVTLGATPPLTHTEARSRARQLLARVDAGADPQAEEQELRRRAKLEAANAPGRDIDTVMARYFDEKRRRTKPRTVDEQARLFARDVAPTLGRRSVSDVVRADVKALHTSMADRPVLANRVLFLLRAFFNWAETEGMRDDGRNPARNIALFPERARDRVATPTELKRLRRAWCIEHARRGAGDPSLAALQLIALTGWRKREVFTLRWDAVDRYTGRVVLQETKTDRSERALSREALALIATQPRLHDSPFVFPSSDPTKPMHDPRAAWDAIRRVARVANRHLHDLRHTFASTALALGIPYEVRQALIGHKAEGMTAQYSHVSFDVLRDAANQVCAQLTERMRYGAHPAPSANVLPMSDYATARNAMVDWPEREANHASRSVRR